MDEAQVQLIIQNVVADALKAQSIILNKTFKEFEDKLAAYDNERRRAASFYLSLEPKSPSYDFATKDILINPILPCPSLSRFPSDCSIQPTIGLNQTTDLVSNRCTIDKINIFQNVKLDHLKSSNNTGKCHLIVTNRSVNLPKFYPVSKHHTKSFTYELISCYLRFPIINNHAFWKIYPPPKIIK